MTWLLKHPYLLWHLIFVFGVSLVVWSSSWRYLLQYKKTILYIAVLSFLWGLIFNLVASAVLKLWFYNNTLGIFFFGLPLEEYLFLLLVPQELVCILLLIRRKIYG